jgi:hypothetical protein
MRLGQLSRKLDLKPTEIRELIRKEFNVEIDLDLNTRIEDSYADAISAKFQPAEKVQTETIPVVTETKIAPVEIPVQEIPKVVAELKTEAEPVAVVSPEIPENTTETKDESAAFIPLPVDPNAELIKVPKIKLDGLKVVGKIDLPQPKAKEIVEENAETIVADTEHHEAQTETPKSFKERRLKNPPVLNNDDEEYSIFKDKKGIYHFSQTQRENRKNSQERIKREKQEELRKQKKVKHYQQIVESEKKTESPAKKGKKHVQKELKRQPEKPVSKGVWGKFVNWLKG